MLYHLSTKDLDLQTIYPKIPSNYMTNNSFEDNITPRICFSKSIEGCILSLSKKKSGMNFNVYIPLINQETLIIKPTIQQVPDSHITEELWLINPVQFKKIANIILLKPIDKPYTYHYGQNNTAELYNYTWQFI